MHTPGHLFKDRPQVHLETSFKFHEFPDKWEA